MDSPYKRNKNRKKNTIPNTTITQTQSQKSNEKNKKTKIIKKNNTLKGGNPDDVCLSGEELIEQAFQDDKEKKNHQKDTTKFVTIARKMVDKL